ncbi:FAD-binding domain-containing protein [Mollisia scopiformis]|uniref:FAD-binding domain-containing protein n=1 Tax=Mollisia scopiformis TaxID=149040 RepID=A0A194XG48_MOLSC|nr:FAD-binding domain-containing protein [Mollisia scopiformis]KUJ18747.1 FAD-binding domain-containing protein [Mollisia scopiformis]
MGVSSYARVAASLLTVSSVIAQSSTITVDNQTVAVNASTLSPAVAIVSDEDLSAPETLQLTDAVVANLTSIDLANASLFAFDDNATSIDARSLGCKVFPGDQAYPSTLVWYIFDLLLGQSLIKTVPLAAPCYNDWPSEENAALCTTITNNWTDSYLHEEDPTSIMWPLYQGRTCMPTDDPTANCTLGAYPSYAVNVSSVAQIQLAVNFARNANLRLVVKNTGHDFNGKSAGAGALSIWTHHLRDITYIPEYNSTIYTGKAVKMGAGVRAFEIYTAAQSLGVTVVGGEGRTVGVGGGFLAGGGHSPLSSLYGMAADQVLSIEVVTPDGRFVTASLEENPDLFWGLRGGGGSTFGVVVSVTARVYPVLPVTVMTFSFATSTNLTSTTFWEGVRTYFDYFVEYTDAGIYAYFSTILTGADSYSFGMAPFFAPNKTVSEVEALVAPWFDRLAALGITITPVINEYSDFYDAWWANFPLETVGITNIKTASRLFPKSNWANDTSLNATFDAIKTTVELGGSFLAFNIAAAENDNSDNSVNPAWRGTCLHAILATLWDSSANDTTIVEASETLTYDWMQKWRDVSPNAGAYMSEADISEPNFQQAFYGTNYDRLYALKQQYDPKSLFYTPTGVGSENWYITGQLTGLPTQNGRLCPV